MNNSRANGFHVIQDFQRKNGFHAYLLHVVNGRGHTKLRDRLNGRGSDKLINAGKTVPRRTGKFKFTLNIASK